MNKVYSRRNWQNEPSIATPLNDVNLNAMDYALDVVDTRVVNIDTTKANQSDLLQTVKSVTYNTTTGVFTFTFWNGTEVTVDLNIEKIPVSFSMSPQGVITMTTADGMEYTADVSELIKTYSFVDSSEIDFSVTTDASGNKDVTASIKAGSITGEKLQPNYLADCVSAKQSAESARDNAAQSSRDSNLSSQDAEAWAVGERNGQPVPSSDPTYENNAKWWAEHGTGNSFSGLTDTNFTNLQNGQIAKYDATTHKWINTEDEGGLLPHFYIDSEAGSTVTVTTPSGGTITPTLMSSGHWECDVPTYGTYIVHAVLNGEDATKTVAVNEVREYHITDTHFSYTLSVYAPQDSMIRIEATGETYTDVGEGSTAVVFSLGQKETQYTITVTYDGLTRTDSVTTPSTSGQSSSKTITFGTINLTVDEDLIGETIVMAKGTDTVSKVASSTSMVFYPNATGNWRISVDYEGETVYAEPDPIVVSSLSTPVSAELSLVKIPEGSTVTPTDVIQTWLSCANITDKSYTTLAEVLADRETFETLLRDSNACDYMARSTSWADNVVDDADAMALIGKYDYCSNALLGNATWAEAIANSDYWNSVLQPLVPTMTSNTTPSGECFGSGTYNSSYHYAFDGVITMAQGWASQNDANDKYVGYEFTTSAQVRKVTLWTPASANNNEVKTFKVQYYNENNEWVDATEVLTYLTATQSSAFTKSYVVNTTASSTKWRLLVLTNIANNNIIRVCEAQFYGRANGATNTNGIIHTAMGNDSVYCVETGDTFTATDGIATVDFSQFDEGVYTFGSTTAKNPDNLSQDYTKQFRITKSPYGGTTELYLMPDTVKMLYWWGYIGDNTENAITANGWSSPQGFTCTSIPTYNANNLYLATTGSYSGGFGTKNKISANTLHSIQKTTVSYGGYPTWCRFDYSNKYTDSSNTSSGYMFTTSDNVMQHLTGTPTQDCYFCWATCQTRAGYLYALWYE